jgi:hypothetical protein
MDGVETERDKDVGEESVRGTEAVVTLLCEIEGFVIPRLTSVTRKSQDGTIPELFVFIVRRSFSEFPPINIPSPNTLKDIPSEVENPENFLAHITFPLVSVLTNKTLFPILPVNTNPPDVLLIELNLTLSEEE